MNASCTAPAAGHFDLAASKRQAVESVLAFAEGRELPAWPLELFLEISNVCNLKCAMCSTFSALNPQRYVELKAADRGFIDIASIRGNLDELLRHVLNVHCFGYGEPTIHPDFRDFVRFLADYRVMIDFFTNGMHLSTDLCAFLVDCRVERVTVSFSGLTKEEYENVYLGGHYETVLQGIETLADEKSRRNSQYPLIEINSLAFEHHIQKLDRFVDFMADHGANAIHLKRLQTQFSIPQLRGHAALLRPWVEGEILARARRRAEARRVVFSAAQFEMSRIDSQQEWLDRKNPGVQNDPGLAVSSPNGVVPIAEFKRLSREAKPVRPPPGNSYASNLHDHQVAPERLEQYLGIAPVTGPGEGFYCMEPFKTLYVRRNGFVKPCCFANDEAPPLGNAMRANGTEIWNGPRYAAVRQGILNQRYPDAACAYCLKNGIGPRKHNFHVKVDAYLAWYRASFGENLMTSPGDRLKAAGDNRELATRFIDFHPGFRSAPVAPAPASDNWPIRHPVAVRRLAERIAALDRSGQPLDTVIEGHLDGLQDGCLSGWIWSPLFPRKRFDVLLYDFDEEIACVTANVFRSDLLQAGKGDGRCAFALTLPGRLYDGTVHGFRARLLGTDFFLRSAPLIVTLPPSAPERTDGPAGPTHRQRDRKANRN